jgi:hypothetical protein
MATVVGKYDPDEMPELRRAVSELYDSLSLNSQDFAKLEGPIETKIGQYKQKNNLKGLVEYLTSLMNTVGKTVTDIRTIASNYQRFKSEVDFSEQESVWQAIQEPISDAISHATIIDNIKDDKLSSILEGDVIKIDRAAEVYNAWTLQALRKLGNKLDIIRNREQ